MTRDALHAEIDIELPPLVTFAAIARAWLTEAPAALAAPQMSAALASGAPEGSLARHQGAFGPPGTPWGSVVLAPYSRPRRRSASLYAFTERSYARFLAKLETEVPERAELKFSELTQHGDTGGGDPRFFHVRLDGPDIDRGRPSVVRLVAHRPTTSPAQPPVSDELADEWAGFTEAFLASLSVPVLYGQVAHDMPEETGRTAFEMETHGWPFESGDPLALRGYGWITVLSLEQAAQVGGPGGLRNTGAFVRVGELGPGSVVLRATTRLSDYDDTAAGRVREALSPLLAVAS